MKIKSIHLRGYKRFEDRTFNFIDEDTGLIKNLIVIVGKNGSGKTSILQAVASLLGTAVGKLKSPSDLDWVGYNYKLINSRPNILLSLTAHFDDDENNATREFHRQLGYLGSIGRAEQVPLALDFLRDKVIAGSSSKYNQFKGRYYAIKIRELEPNTWHNFNRVGTVLWYTEQRTATSLSAETIVSHEEGNGGLNIDEEKLRQRLSALFDFNFRIENDLIALREGQRNVYELLRRFYEQIFVDKRFVGPDISSRIDFDRPPYFKLSDRSINLDYEISEMSGGERALFPILLDFANWNTNKSVILIDELELHLHPPLQQSFLRALPNLGNDNQFIITTHSDYVASLVPESSIIRLD